MRRKTVNRQGPGIISGIGMAMAYAAAHNRKMKAVHEKNDPKRRLHIRISGSSESQ